MPPKANTSNEGDETPSFTSSELKLLHAVFRNAPSTAKPATNWDAVARDCGLKDGYNSHTRFRQVSKKYGWFNASAQEVTNASTPTPGSKRAKKAISDDGDEDMETPSKSKKAGKKHAAKAIQTKNNENAKKRKASHMDDEEEDGQLDNDFDDEA